MLCVVCRQFNAIIGETIDTSWDTCKFCTGKAVELLKEQSNPQQQVNLVPVNLDFDLMIGSLDRKLSEFLYACDDPALDAVNAHTLKHHADDLIGVGTHAKKKLVDRGEV